MSVVGGDLITTLLAEDDAVASWSGYGSNTPGGERGSDLNVLESGCLVLLEAVCEPEQLSAVRAEINAVLLGRCRRVQVTRK